MINIPVRVAMPASAAARPLRRPYELIDPVADFGVVGDGVTDNSAALMAMRSHMAARPDVRFKVVFPAGGHYCYVNNLWLNGVYDVIVDGRGSAFQCLHPEQWTSDAPLFTRHLFDDAPPDEPFSFNEPGRIVGCPQAPLKTVAQGSTTVEILPPIGSQPHAAAEDFAPGDRVFLWGYDQQLAHYPPNCRYYEWNEVASVDSGTQTVTLVNPTEHEYRDDWRDAVLWDDVWFGSARMFKLDRPNFRYPNRVELQNMVFFNNTNSTGSQGFRVIADELFLENCDFTQIYFWLGQNRIAFAKNCSIDRSDLDKLAGSLVLDGCSVTNKLEPATGFQSVTVQNCTINGTVSLCARRNYIDNCVINASGFDNAINARSSQHIDVFSASNNVIQTSADGVNIKTNVKLPFSAIDVLDSKTLVLNYTQGETNSVIRKIAKDSWILVNEQSAVSVEKVTFDQQNENFLIDTNGANLSTSDTFHAISINNLSLENNSLETGVLKFSRTAYALLMKSEGHFEQIFRNKGIFEMETWANLDEIKLEILEPHQDTAGHDKALVILRAFTADDVHLAEIQCSAVHQTTAQTGENGEIEDAHSAVNNALSPGQYVQRLRLSCYRSTDTWEKGFGGSPEEWPVIRVSASGRSVLSS